MKKTVAIAAMGLAASLAGAAQASTISFSNGSGSYSADGVTATVTVTTSSAGGGLYYNSTENAIGVGNSATNGGIGYQAFCAFCFPTFTTFTEAETMTVTFDQEVTVDTVFFRQWENNILGYGDEVHFNYSGGASGTGSILFSNSGLSDLTTLLDPFSAGVSLTAFTITPEQDGSDSFGVTNDTVVYLHSVDFTVSQVPLPGAAWLMGSALLGLVGVSRRRSAR
ncbi:MAG: hypothetical protein H6985_06475 [Pseudomonadales bacterium]|nr:VPLPA-CTERM sorting domain-containing protein [Halioglobus sp.]MCP5129209.1 hypothetical protein [Pseudomonadales bacterium]